MCSWWTVLCNASLQMHCSTPKSYGLRVMETLVYFMGGVKGERARERDFLSVVMSLCHLGPITLDSISVWSCFPLLFLLFFKSVWGLSVILFYMLTCSFLATSDLALIMLMTLCCGHCMKSLCVLWVDALCGSGHFKRAIFVYRGFFCILQEQSHTFVLFTRGFQPIYLNGLSQRRILGYLLLNMSMDSICWLL